MPLHFRIATVNVALSDFHDILRKTDPLQLLSLAICMIT